MNPTTNNFSKLFERTVHLSFRQQILLSTIGVDYSAYILSSVLKSNEDEDLSKYVRVHSSMCQINSFQELYSYVKDVIFEFRCLLFDIIQCQGKSEYSRLQQLTPIADGLAMLSNPYDSAGFAIYSYCSNLDCIFSDLWDFSRNDYKTEGVSSELVSIGEGFGILNKRAIELQLKIKGFPVDEVYKRFSIAITELLLASNDSHASIEGNPIKRDLVDRITGNNNFLNIKTNQNE